LLRQSGWLILLIVSLHHLKHWSLAKKEIHSATNMFHANSNIMKSTISTEINMVRNLTKKTCSFIGWVSFTRLGFMVWNLTNAHSVYRWGYLRMAWESTWHQLYIMQYFFVITSVSGDRKRIITFENFNGLIIQNRK
jgi:hypothetical protein